jgi:hypothetical protein
MLKAQFGGVAGKVVGSRCDLNRLWKMSRKLLDRVSNLFSAGATRCVRMMNESGKETKDPTKMLMPPVVRRKGANVRVFFLQNFNFSDSKPAKRDALYKVDWSIHNARLTFYSYVP